MDRAELASTKHRNGFNCCQSVVCVFADELGIDESLLYKIGEGFGAGMGTTQGVCGAISGAAMVAGLVHSDGNTPVLLFVKRSRPETTERHSPRAMTA